MGAQTMAQEMQLPKGWNLITESLPLNFANTMDWHASAQPIELLKSYFDLVDWSLAVGLLEENDAQYLRKEAENHPEQASAVVEKSRELRELIYNIFSGIAHDQDPERSDLALMNDAYIDALSHANFLPSSNGFEWSWVHNKRAFDGLLWPIAYSAVELLTSDDKNNVGQCSDDRGCGWLFLDTSRNHSRRWCRMEECGNRAKAHRHYHKKTKRKD